MPRPYYINPNPVHLTDEEITEGFKKIEEENKRIRRSFKYDRISMSKQVTPNPYKR